MVDMDWQTDSRRQRDKDDDLSGGCCVECPSIALEL